MNRKISSLIVLTVLQIICDREINSTLAEVKEETAGLSLNESPKKTFVIGKGNSKQTVFQFNNNKLGTNRHCLKR